MVRSRGKDRPEDASLEPVCPRDRLLMRGQRLSDADQGAIGLGGNPGQTEIGVAASGSGALSRPSATLRLALWESDLPEL